MGLYHRKKPSQRPAKKAPPAMTPEEIQAKADRTAFIEQMAARAAIMQQEQAASASASGISTPVEGEVAIHPSRLALAHEPAGRRGQQFSSRNNRQAHRAPDLRDAKKRSFKDMEESAQPQEKGVKRQRTLAEIKKLKGPAAVKKELAKRQREAELAKANPKAPESTADVSTGEPAEKKEKLDKAARKAAKIAPKQEKKEAKASKQAETQEDVEKKPNLSEHATESKEARKARKKAEKEAKQEARNEAKKDITSIEAEPVASAASSQATKDEEKERKRAKKAAKAAAKEAAAKEAVTEQSVQSSNWSGAASALGSKSAKFMKLLGGAKTGVTTTDVGRGSQQSSKAMKQARRAEVELEKQFTHGMQAKQNGTRRSGLGA